MTNPSQALDQNFFYNSMLARALVALIPERERFTVRVWLQKLEDMLDESVDDRSIRNEYMWFLLLQLQNKHINSPFDRDPPHADLRPLKDILPIHVYEEVLNTTDQDSWVEKELEGKKSGGMEDCGCGSIESMQEAGPPRTPPGMFLSKQPVPQDGVICYMAVFSDQNY